MERAHRLAEMGRTVVRDEPAAESAAQRVQRLHGEAREAAGLHILALILAMNVAREQAIAVAEGGDVYPSGIRDLARRFAADAEARVQSIEALNGRSIS